MKIRDFLPDVTQAILERHLHEHPRNRATYRAFRRLLAKVQYRKAKSMRAPLQ